MMLEINFPKEFKEVEAGLLLTVLVLFIYAIAWANVIMPPQGYESSIYSAYPLTFWLLFVFMYFVLFTIISWGEKKIRASTIMVASTFFLASLPLIRGYPLFGRADVLVNLGLTRQVIEYGAIGDNPYPLLHVISAQLDIVTALSLKDIVSLFLPMTYIISSIVSCVWLKRIMPNVYWKILPFLLLPFLKSELPFFAPSVFSFLLLPYFLYLFDAGVSSSNNIRVTLLISVYTVSLSFAHPVTSISIIIIFIVKIITIYISGEPVPKPIRYVVVVMSILIFYWVYKQPIFDVVVVRTIVNPLFSKSAYVGEPSAANQYSSVISQYSPGIVDLAKIFFIRFGEVAALFTIMLILSHQIIRYYLHQASRTLKNELLSALCICFVFSIVGLGALIWDLIISLGRVLRYVQYFTPILIGGGVSYTKRDIWNNALRAGYLLLVFLLITSIVFGMFYSPMGGHSNQQVTQMELSGTEWLTSEWNSNLGYNEIGISMQRYSVVVADPKTSLPRTGLRPPSHFGYNNGTSIGAKYESDLYLIVTKKGKNLYPTRYPNYRKYWRYYPEDFTRLNYDSKSAKVYSNGGYTVFRIDSY